jgi:hypothetical protein
MAATSRPPIEVIVIDDASKDDTLAMLTVTNAEEF